MRAVIYARYSSDLQSMASIEDQIRLCRERVEQENGTVVEIYADYALSGSNLRNRPSMQALLAQAKKGNFDYVIAEALDRVSRDQEDIAAIYKRLRHLRVQCRQGSALQHISPKRGTGFGCSQPNLGCVRRCLRRGGAEIKMAVDPARDRGEPPCE
jgi:DNA invertase Pin-like site-specific DNA recombinase